MAKVTSKLQVTLPKRLAAQYGIEPGCDIEWQAAGEAIRVLPAAARRPTFDKADRLARYDAATTRQKHRERTRAAVKSSAGSKRETADRGWTREELYDRGTTR